MKMQKEDPYAVIGMRFVDLVDDAKNLLSTENEAVEEMPDTFEVQADEGFPWLDKILEYEGLHEIDDNDKLKEILTVDPIDTPWCADIITQSLKAAGKPALGLRAREYANYGEEGDGSVGDLAVWQGHIGVVVDENDVIGGNVSNEVKRSPHPGNHPDKDWFRGFIGFRKVV